MYLWLATFVGANCSESGAIQRNWTDWVVGGRFFPARNAALRDLDAWHCHGFRHPLELLVIVRGRLGEGPNSEVRYCDFFVDPDRDSEGNLLVPPHADGRRAVRAHD